MWNPPESRDISIPIFHYNYCLTSWLISTWCSFRSYLFKFGQSELSFHSQLSQPNYTLIWINGNWLAVHSTVTLNECVINIFTSLFNNSQISEILPGDKLHHYTLNIQCFGHYLYPIIRDTCGVTIQFSSTMTQLIVQEYFIAFSQCESFKSYQFLYH